MRRTRVQESQNWSSEARRCRAASLAMLCNMFIVGAYTQRRGEARQETPSCFFTSERYSLAKANHCTAHSNEYSSLRRFYNFELPSRRSYSRHHTHMREARRSKATFASARSPYARRGELRLASRICECPFKFTTC